MRRALCTAFVALVACDGVDFMGMPPAVSDDTACSDDSECAPNACCGEGDTVVHVSHAPDCSQATCSGSCPVHGIKCGCAIPICRDGKCAAAISTTPDCS